MTNTVAQFNIAWEYKTVPIDQLKPYEKNPRTITKAAFIKLKNAIRSLGFHTPIKAQPDMTIAGGHQRLKALKEFGVTEVPVLIASRTLSEDEFKQLLIQDNINFGEFNFEQLSEQFDAEELVEYGVPESLMANYEPEAFETGKPEQQGRLDEKGPAGKIVRECPKCGHSFTTGS